MRKILPSERVYSAISVPIENLSSHLRTMINLQCHLIWIDANTVNKINYFNFIWISNEDSFELNSLNPKFASIQCPKPITAKPPSFLIFYDLNTAQLAHLYKEYSQEKNWNLELIESYSRINLPNRKKTKKSSVSKISSTKSYEEIFFICQFGYNDSNKNSKLNNKLHHSVIDTRFDEVFKQTVKHNFKQTMYHPIRVSPLLINVNTVNNSHLYYSSLYMPIDYYKPVNDDDYDEKNSDLTSTSLFTVRKNLTDLELMNLFEELTSVGMKLVDLKAHKDEKSIVKFSTVWSSMHGFYEGTSKFFIGLNKEEILNKTKEMKSKFMYPKMITNYGYLNGSGEHVYAIFFCQF